MYIKYVGQSHYRKITPEDFASVGFDSHGIDVCRNDVGNAVVLVNKQIGTWLIENEAGEWEEVEDKDADATIDESLPGPPPSVDAQPALVVLGDDAGTGDAPVAVVDHDDAPQDGTPDA